MCLIPVYQALAVVEQAAAEETYREMLIASNVTDALVATIAVPMTKSQRVCSRKRMQNNCTTEIITPLRTQY